MEVTKWLKPSISVSRIGDSASVQAATRVNAEQCGHACQFGKDRPQQFRTLPCLIAILDALGARPPSFTPCAFLIASAALVRREISLRSSSVMIAGFMVGQASPQARPRPAACRDARHSFVSACYLAKS